MSRPLYFLYGLAAHLAFLFTFVYMAGFVGNLWVPKSIDAPGAGFSLVALIVDIGLVALFAIPHSVMARPAFKRWWTRFVPEPIERSTYVWITCVTLAVLMWQWRPLGPVLWSLESDVVRTAAYALYSIGWLMVPAVSLLINHFDLFGTRQVWLHFRGKPYEHLPLRAPGAYRYVRHPLYVAWMIAFWVTPTMSLGHLTFAIVNTAYMLVAIRFEERDLIELHGEAYAKYRRRVPMLVPGGVLPVVEPNDPAGVCQRAQGGVAS